jgi:hypothetical protein
MQMMRAAVARMREKKHTKSVVLFFNEKELTGEAVIVKSLEEKRFSVFLS